MINAFDPNSREFVDSEGRFCTLDAMCRREPEWAARMLRILAERAEKLHAELCGNDTKGSDVSRKIKTSIDDGESMIVRCPFHAEKTPSMSIKGGRFFCFGCQASGRVDDFRLVVTRTDPESQAK